MPPRQRIQANRKPHQKSTRIYMMHGVIGFLMLVLIGGLGFRQLVQNAAFAAAEERQNYRRILLPGPRGIITDRHDNVLVGNRPLFTAAVYLNELRPEFRSMYFQMVREQRDIGLNPDRYELNVAARQSVVQKYLDQLNELLGLEESIDSRKVERHFAQSLLLPFPLIEDLSGDQYAILLSNLRLDSPIQLITSSARYYPFEEAAAHTLGFVSHSIEFEEGDLPGDELLTFRRTGKIGRAGIEKAFNDHLQGKAGSEIWTVDPSGFQYERVGFQAPKKGNDLQLSLDIQVQMAAESGLAGKTGAAVAIEIQTGEILALASSPAYDLNDLSPVLNFQTDKKIREAGAWLNRAIQGLYPPGSTFKLVTALAGLRTGFINQATVVDCPGYHQVGRRTFHCHRRSGHGEENLVEAIRDSCNVFFYERGLEIGVDAIATEARRFRLDQPTGIELKEETGRMLIPDPDWKARRFYGEAWFDGDTANLSIGQGFLLVTPLQMATFVASLARDAYFIQPTLLHDPNRQREPVEKIAIPDIDLNLIRAGMQAAGERGTARLAGSPRLPVAGKTGTAQVRKEGQPTTLAWFVGYAPASRPRIAVAILVEGVPQADTQYGGGSTAAPIARTIFESYLQPR